MLLLPVFDDGHSPRDVALWDLDDYGWWYLLRARRIKEQRKADEQARARAELASRRQ
jgi:hypothetical protein